MKKVLVYLASYNGQNYLKEQLDSILSQKGVEVSLLIADDNSNDGTLEILEEYSKKFKNISYYQNKENLGYRLNFISLISHKVDGEYDYYALSDQDDVWLEDKLEKATSRLEKENDDQPLLYSSNLSGVDKDLNPIGMMFPPSISKTNDYQRFLNNIATGCTCVFNNSLRNLLLEYPLEEIKQPHDGIICKIAIATGKYIYDPSSSILYRQHGTNSIGMHPHRHQRLYDFFHSFHNKNRDRFSETSMAIFNTYESRIKNPDIRKFIYSVGSYKSSFKTRFKIYFSRRYSGDSFISTIFLKAKIFFRLY